MPEGLRGILNWIRTSYNNVPVFITENGYCDLGQLADDDRVHYYEVCLESLPVLKMIFFSIGYSAKFSGGKIWKFINGSTKELELAT